MVHGILRVNINDCWLLQSHGKITIAYGLQMGNNLLTTAGAIALAKAINESESSEMEELDLTVCAKTVDLLENFR